MYKEHDIFQKPSDNAKIWRYMDLTKFLSLLHKEALFFSRSDLLGDRFEGSLPKTEGQESFTDHVKERLKQFGKKEIELPSDYVSMHEFIRKTCYICSFHLNQFESAALWKLYLKTNEGVAIQSTFKKLIEGLSVSQKYEVLIGRVQYIDYSAETIPITENMLYPLIFKRKSFEYENELRAMVAFPREIYPDDTLPDPKSQIMIDLNKIPNGLYVPIDLEKVIENVYIAPTAPSWIKELIQSLIEQFGFAIQVKQSILDEDPIF